MVLVDASSVLAIKTLAKRLFRFAGPDAASARETSCIFGSEERRSHVLARLVQPISKAVKRERGKTKCKPVNGTKRIVW